MLKEAQLPPEAHHEDTAANAEMPDAKGAVD